MKLRFECPSCGGDVDISAKGVDMKEIVQCTFCDEWVRPEFDEIIRVEPHTCWILEDKND